MIKDSAQTVAECSYCGSRQTVPTGDDEKKINLFARAGRLMRACEFDKAAGIYENILADFPTEAEAYWGLVISKFGIEYVDDPATGNKVPTCHRSSFESVLEGSDFEQACENADVDARRIYRNEAKQIEELRKGIIEVSANEQPYDIFISYKEKDDSGERTIDSVLAQDIYDALCAKGYRTFFSRISLEDKLGIEYEPYIFAALNSARVMLVVGTDYDHFNAVWVKNEWSRFLKLMAKDKEKHLIPCFKDLDAYDMPKEFSKLTAQDLGKVGAVQDLLRGIDKLLGGRESSNRADQEPTVMQEAISNPNADSLATRGNMALEDGSFEEAKGFFNRVLDIVPSTAEAYLGLAMANAQCHSIAEFGECIANGYSPDKTYNRAKQFASEELLKQLLEYEEKNTQRLQKIEELKAILEAKLKDQAAEQERRIKEKISTIAKNNMEQINLLKAQLKAAQDRINLLKIQLKENESAEYPLDDAEQQVLNALKQKAKATSDEANRLAAEHERMRQEQESQQMEEQIKKRQSEMASLGLFKGKEKKQLQEQIVALEETLKQEKEKLQEKSVQASAAIKQKTKAEKQLQLQKDALVQSRAAKRERERQKITNEIGKQSSELVAASVSSTVNFGEYKKAKEIESIEWRILDVTDAGMLLITEQAVDCKKYNETYTDVTWETCTLRKWLNTTFLNTAFTEEEKAMIATVTVTSDKNPKYSTSPGNDTQDQLLLLSIDEANKYFKTDEDRKCVPTAYTKAQGAYTNDDYTVDGKATCWWWLRSPGSLSDLAAIVRSDGSVYYYGRPVDRDYGAVRPALWINLES